MLSYPMTHLLVLLCSPKFQGLPSGYNFSPSSGGTIDFGAPQCFGVRNSDLVSGGGVCNLSCPNTCKVTITKDVSGSVCASSGSSSSSGNEDDNSPASMRALSAITTVVIAGVVAMIT